MATPTPAELPRTADVVVVGGGVVGLWAALLLRQRRPDLSVVVLEKEASPGRHGSGRNSGVLHAGFYYGADTLKARTCRRGNLAWRAFLAERGVTVRDCGKLVVARSAAELAGLQALWERGQANGVPVELVDEAQAQAIEPRARTMQQALYSPSTASVDPAAAMSALAAAAVQAGVRLCPGAGLLGVQERVLQTAAGPIEAGFVLNTAGLQADRVARWFGFGDGYRVLPFRGLYLVGDEPPGALRCHVYPVPDLALPFLGVHLTVTVDGGAKIGPNAQPALWLEQYRGFENFAPAEVLPAATGHLRLLLAGASYRRLACRELRLLRASALRREASALVRGLHAEHWRRWGRAGIRAQLVDRRTGRLAPDFVLQGDDRSLHVLNAVSPGFTSAPAFADLLLERLPG